MSSDDYFDGDMDSAFLQQVDELEAAHTQKQQAPSRTLSAPGPSHQVIELDDSDEFDVFDIGEADIKAFDLTCSNVPSSSRPISNNTRLSRHSSMGTVQTTLFGGIVAQKPVSNTSNKLSSSTLSTRPPNSDRDRQRPKKTKQWDHTAFAKTGWKNPKPKSNGKQKGFENEEQEENEDWDSPTEFEQFPAPQVSVAPPAPMKLHPDLLATKQWIFPLNQPKRDYQYNIVKRCLFDNTLVALPTGLGKTFIAGVVMLNFYTWFPEGKAVFVAPTKPLVAQQIDACHKTCGIPGSHAAELTGQNARAVRAKEWQEKRVFYMTPQTLMNDLRTDNCDPRDIVLLVIDEAHKGTGDYAYAQVIRYMMAKNPYFRVLALTATPGSNPEAVQEIVDALHISRIEIRDEQSLDLVSYMHKKNIQQHYIDMTEEYQGIVDLLSPMMEPLIKSLSRGSILPGRPTPTTLHPYSCLSAMKSVQGRRDKPTWALKPLSVLSKLARAMGYLIENSMSMCYSHLSEETSGSGTSSKKAKAKSKLSQDPQFQAVLRELERHKLQGFPPHPKMEKLKVLLVQHFANEMLDKDENTGNQPLNESRVMVFATYRENVDEIVATLNQEQPMIRASRFVGQGTDKKGHKGYAQKEQLEVIRKFKNGDFNVLVSTSIGEEGLDIGEVDMIVCYDAQKAPIRMLQRVGRTGRKRDGTVHVLLAAGREERNWDKAVDAYEAVQTFIVKAEHLELYDDVERMIPTHIKPECVELMMEIEPYVREEPKPRKGSPSKPAPKRKKDRDVERNIPAGALKGFISASKLKPKKRTEFDPSGCESDEEDKELEAGIFGPRRTVSLTAKDSMKQKKPRRATTIAGASSRKGKSKAKANEEPIRAQQTDVLEIEDDSDDQSIQKGLFNSKKRSRSPLKTPPRRSKRAEPMPMSSPEVPLVDEISDLVTPGPSHGTVTESQTLSIPSSSPELPLLTNTSHQSDPSCEVATASSATSKSSTTQPTPEEEDPDEDDDMAWLVAADSSPDIRLVHSSPINVRRPPRISDRADSEEIVEDSEPALSLCGSPRPLTPTEPSSPGKAIHDDVRMPPPALPTRFLGSSPKDSLSEMPEPTFAVRPLGKNHRKRLLIKDSDSSPAMPPLSQRRLQRHQLPPSPIPDSPPPKRRKRLFKDAAEVQKHNPWVELEASHSGDEKDIGSSDVEDVANASDLQFVDELPETQVSPSYNQTAIYRQSLLTQVPGRNPGGPVFSKQPARRGANWFKESASPRQTVSSPSRTEAASDDYVLGSFVVDDEADISYTDDT